MADSYSTAYIYVITNTVNGKQYVGQTRLGIERRWAEHCRRSRKRLRECSALYPAMLYYGEAAFTVALHRELANALQDDVDAAEREAIASLGTLRPLGYNLTTGGFGGGPIHPETKEKLREFNRGRKRSASEIEKTAAALRGRTRPPDVIAKVRAGNIGKKRSPEQREAMSLRHRGMKASPEAKARMSAAQKGRQFTPEWCAKISAAKKGKAPRPAGFKHTAETKAKIKATNKATWARKHGGASCRQT